MTERILSVTSERDILYHNIALDDSYITSDGIGFNMGGSQDTVKYSYRNTVGSAAQNMTFIFFSFKVLDVEYQFSGKCFQKCFIVW